MFRNVQIRGLRSAADCMNDRNHRRAAAPKFEHPQHSSRCDRTQREFASSGVGLKPAFSRKLLEGPVWAASGNLYKGRKRAASSNKKFKL
ncbi:hypothetical protein C1J02_09135 [Sulfitobacter sp. SK011]|nr:hypothetical protein C1J02_09135 [Sulfitobacter sp. SK011]